MAVLVSANCALCRLKQLEEENHQLKKLVAELGLDKQMLQDVLRKKFYSQPTRGIWPTTLISPTVLVFAGPAR